MRRKSFATVALLALLAFAPPARAQAQQQQPCVAPGISFWKLLDAVGVGYGDGRLYINTLYAVCLPTPARPSSSNYPYDPEGGGKLTTVVKTADGKVLNTFVWYAESIGGLWELSRYKVVGGYESVKPLAAGNYALEFAVEDKTFYKFPFSVVEVKNEDPYQPPGSRYLIEGAWNEYGNIFYQRNDPQSSVRFTTWVQDRSGRGGQKSVPYALKLFKGDRLLAEDAGTLRTEPRWLKLELSLRPAGGDQNSFFKAGEILREDGAYSFRLSLDGKPYGEYPFTVKGGRIEFQGRQVREKTDPTLFIVDYINGGRHSSWWIKRQPAK